MDNLEKAKENFLMKEKALSQYACKSSDSIRLIPEQEDIRPPFFHDSDRIIHSLSYTRYLDKTQVFTREQNDHISKRITHVQFVSKVARTIGRALNLNTDLIEAIALGHDIGHTPLGHSGETILNEIQNNTYIKLYSFSYIYDNNNVLDDKPGNKTIGNVYKRSFIEMYDICFCKEGSYADQDYGFNTACRLTFDHLQQIYHFHPMRKHVYIPTFYEHISNKSLTKINNSEFSFTKFPQGIIINGMHAISNTNITVESGVKQLCHIMAIQYYAFIMAVSYEYKNINDTWKIIRDFYFQYYRQYRKYALKFLQSQFKFTALPLIQKIKRKKIGVNYNMKRFIEELETEENCPSRYLT